MSEQNPHPTGPEAGQHPARGGDPWRRLASGLRFRITRGHVLGGVLMGVLGFALVVQLGSTDEANLSALRQSDLVRILDDVTERSDRLRQEASELESTRDELLTSTDRNEAARAQAQERVDVLSILAGTAPATGPGIELRLRGDEIDARLLVDAVQELRDAGAEAIQVNNVRVVASTAFVDTRAGVEAGGTVLEPPYLFKAIGDPQTLATAMSFPDGVVEKVQPKGSANVEQLDVVSVDALRSLKDPQYARPADPAEPTSPSTP